MNFIKKRVSASRRNQPPPEIDDKLYTAGEIFEESKEILAGKKAKLSPTVSTVSSIGSRDSISIMSQGYAHTSGAIKGMQRLEELQKTVEMNKKIREMELELIRTYESGKEKRLQYKREINVYRNKISGVGRSLWLKQKNQKHNPMAGMSEYKNAILRCSLPCHDRSPNIIANEARLLRAGHTMKIITHQLNILKEKEHELVDFMLRDCLPVSRNDHINSRKEIQKKVKEAMESRDAIVEAYENYLVVQRKIIAKTKLRGIEDDNLSVDSSDMELIEMAAGETKTFEVTKLRRSAELRLNKRYGSLEERQARKFARDEVFNKTIENVDAIEKQSLQRAEHIAGEVEQLLASLQVTVNALGEDLGSTTGESFRNGSVLHMPDNLETRSITSGQIPTTLEIVHDENDRGNLWKMGTADDTDDSLSSHSNTDDHNSSQPTIQEDEPLSNEVKKPIEEEEKEEPIKPAPSTMSKSGQKRAAISARLEVLRAKRQESIRLGASSASAASERPSRRQVLDRARSARLSAQKDANTPAGSGPSSDRQARMERLKVGKRRSSLVGASSKVKPQNGGRRLSDARLAEIREKRRNSAAAASG